MTRATRQRARRVGGRRIARIQVKGDSKNGRASSLPHIPVADVVRESQRSNSARSNELFFFVSSCAIPVRPFEFPRRGRMDAPQSRARNPFLSGIARLFPLLPLLHPFFSRSCRPEFQAHCAPSRCVRVHYYQRRADANDDKV